MPRAVPFLLLILALAGPLLTHAEAADDLARVLIGGLEHGQIEAPDGCVGDDPNVASVSRPAPAVDSPQLAAIEWDFSTSAAPVADPSPNGLESGRTHRRDSSWPFPTAPMRAAWLQVFLN